ncbi:MAG: hypothetical protein HZB15_06285, partial [Actinobacteria bacterium]|nr:hypothetical protein [Actinomycetota bacterium]
MSQVTHDAGVVVSDRVIAHDELVAKMALARAELSDRSPEVVVGSTASGASARARRLHHLWNTLAPPVVS